MTVYQYWDEMWHRSKSEDYLKYINLERKPEFIRVFKENRVKSVCDAACGFGKYSALLGYNNFSVSGFDVSETAVELTKGCLRKFDIDYDAFISCSITKIEFEDGRFDAVVAHAVIDHLTANDARQAISELERIVRHDGLIYVTFDGLSDDDLTEEHELTEEGAFLYLTGDRKGMLFKHYRDDEIMALLKEKSIILFNTKENGEREVVYRKV